MAMLKQLSFFKRRPGMEIAAFQEYWRTRHASIVKPLPGMVRYVQNHAVRPVMGDGDAPFDGVAEVWFENKSAMQANVGSDALKRIREDEANFIDASSMGSLITEEVLIVDGQPPATAIKLIRLINRLASVSVESFRDTWRDELGAIISDLPGVARNVQSHVRMGIYRSGGTPEFDGMASLWFRDEAGWAEAGNSPAMQKVTTLEPTFIDHSKSALFWVEEVPIV